MLLSEGEGITKCCRKGGGYNMLLWREVHLAEKRKAQRT